MLSKVLNAIKKYNMIEPGDKIVLGLSGGVDSMALLDVLVRLQDSIGFELCTAHLNHGIRGEYADRDQLFAEKVSKKYGLEFFTKKVNMDDYAKKHKISSEEAGRFLRYEFFNEVIKDHSSGKIAVAHNLNDQAETLIMRFIRGTGIDGLRGIEHRVGNIIRPILDIGRPELEDYIADNGIEITQDHTNFESIYTRNKIRLEVIPYIEENFNPNIVNTLQRTAYLSEIDSDFLEKEGEKRYNEVVKKQGKYRIILDKEKFNNQDISMKQRILRLCILNINSNLQGVSEAQISNMLELFKQGDTGKQIDISNEIVGRVNYEDLVVERQIREEIGKFQYNLKDNVIIDEIGYKFNVEILENIGSLDLKKEMNTMYFDFSKVSGSLKVRNRIDGDKFIPFGMSGQKKIKDYFVDEKIPRELRNQIPLIVDDEKILWVVGYRTSEAYRITKNTKNILKISYEII